MEPISRRGLFKMGAALTAASSLVRSLGAAQRPATGQDAGTLQSAARTPVNPTHHILLRGGIIITMDPALGDFAKGDIHIQGKHIVEVGRDLKVPAGAQAWVVSPGDVTSSQRAVGTKVGRASGLLA